MRVASIRLTLADVPGPKARFEDCRCPYLITMRGIAFLFLYSWNLCCDNLPHVIQVAGVQNVKLIELSIIAGLSVGVVCGSGAIERFQPERVKRVAEDQALKVGSEVTIEGKVLGREKRPEGVSDGEFALRVSTADHGVVNVVFSSFRLCHNEVGASAKEGDRVEVFGKVIRKDRVNVCLSKTYYIKKLPG